MEQAVGTDSDEAGRQHMLQEAFDKLVCRERSSFPLSGFRCFVDEGELAVFKLDQALVADGALKQVGGQIGKGLLPAPTALRWTTHLCVQVSSGMVSKRSGADFFKASRNLARKRRDRARLGMR